MENGPPPVTSLLENYRNKKVFFEHLGGNNGDVLLRLSSIMVLKEKDMKFVANPRKADVIVINAGAKKDEWLDILGHYSKAYPSIPLIILPSSWLFDSNDEIAGLFNNRESPCYIYCREPYSLSLLNKIKFDDWVHLGLDHDMAFQVKGTRYLKNLADKKAEKFILVVERGDDDSVTKLRIPDTLTRRMVPKIVDFIPLRMRFYLSDIIFTLERMLLSKLRRREVDQTEFVKWAVGFIKENHTNFNHLPVYAADISLQAICSFKRFGTIISQAAAVVTTRLHVAILASLLGKPTYLVEGRWYKQKEVYEYSMKSSKNVKLLMLNSLFKN